MKTLTIQNLTIGPKAPLTVVMGPCVIESRELALSSALFLKRLFQKTSLQFIYKSSYDKANRSSLSSFRGPGLQEGLKILEEIKKELDLPLFTDVHSPQEARAAAEVVDVIQIPAFLCRQTDLLVAAGATGAVVNIKKGQFLAPWDMKNVVEKVGTDNLLLTDRGTCFGYNNLVSDLRAIPIMQKLGYPVLYDATHSVQLPGHLKEQSGGDREFVPPLSCAAIAAGCNGIYAEAHPDVSKALCDGPCQIPFDALPALLNKWERLYEATHVDACLAC